MSDTSISKAHVPDDFRPDEQRRCRIGAYRIRFYYCKRTGHYAISLGFSGCPVGEDLMICVSRKKSEVVWEWNHFVTRLLAIKDGS
jgi:hypothetical protein